jgi:hypothetical protein
MFRFLLSAASIFVLISTMILPPAVAARRCGERMPVTLLALYRGSEAIYVGRYEKTEDGEPTEVTADYTVVPIKKHFSISSALKGEPRKMFTLEDTEYRYVNQEIAAEESEHDGEEIDGEQLKPGDSVLLFLKKSEESELLELTDFSDGIKKMTPDKLASYEARIRELIGLFSAEKPNHSQIVEWLVRCAEDPNTRWEGTFELLQSFQNMDWQEERAKQAEEKSAEPGSEETGEYEPEVPKEFDTGDPNFARAVTDGDKQALSNILLNRERSETSDGAPARTLGDRELVELVKRWGDSRVAANLVEQLRLDSSDANSSAELMGSIASMLRDDQLSSVSEEYANIQWESDDADVASGDQASPEPAAVEVGSEVESSGAAEISPEPSDEPAKKRTYSDLRAELLAKFLSRADKVIEMEQSRASERAQLEQ